ncbi:mechanosensitive ion channel family protein [Emticicia sp. BO119]|uniref:mechanosensitive ion channel family protein n=1 Tax=Emticicia sp. BO119 TaxID=2757768 RepID=UPI0015F1246F|nr:mechanosensitive ion channel domain-containing protein [Emticicia sp. BO119]MBA4851768.1 mechanosensitive ion channel [Emticicia sp. BO119]
MNLQEILNYSIIKIGAFDLRVSSILGIALLFFFTIFVIHTVKRAIYRTKKIDEGKKYSLFNLFKYAILIFAIVYGFNIFGLDISVILAGSAALLVGLGIGLQTLFKDFISGIILLVDASIKVGDIIEVNEIVCQISEINLRTTTALTRDDKYIILPNSMLTSNHIQNWTHLGAISRFEVKANVDYSTDIRAVEAILVELVSEHSAVMPEPRPFVRFTEFGDSALFFSVFFWTNDLFRVENIRSELRFSIFEKFKEHKIVIPFPQHDIHMK